MRWNRGRNSLLFLLPERLFATFFFTQTLRFLLLFALLGCGRLFPLAFPALAGFLLFFALPLLLLGEFLFLAKLFLLLKLFFLQAPLFLEAALFSLQPLLLQRFQALLLALSFLFALQGEGFLLLEFLQPLTLGFFGTSALAFGGFLPFSLELLGALAFLLFLFQSLTFGFFGTNALAFSGFLPFSLKLLGAQMFLLFLFQYQEILELAESDPTLKPEELVAFAPDENFAEFSFGSELLAHDGAVAALIACSSTLHRIQERVPGRRWEPAINWIDSQLNRVWRARGAFPGLGSALAAFGFEFGFQHGSLLAHEIASVLERTRSPWTENVWTVVDGVMNDPTVLDSPVASKITPSMQRGWKKLSKEHRCLLELLSRCALLEDQAIRFYDPTTRKDADIGLDDGDILENPYRLYEADRFSDDAVAFGTIDRGMFPEEAIRKAFPIDAKTAVTDPSDRRRVRAFVAHLLEEGARQGHSLLPRDWVIRRARDAALAPPCPLGESVLSDAEEAFADPPKPGGKKKAALIERVVTKDGAIAYQLDTLAACRKIIRTEVRGRVESPKRHVSANDWRKLLDEDLPALPTNAIERRVEERARVEKTAALEEIYASRLSVLVGPAGTGKTKLLKVLCGLPDLAAKGILLLAPTGKARVRLEEQTGQRGAGCTLAQFLNQHKRYDGSTGRCFPSAESKCTDFKTVIVDECSMLTEEQLGALFDALSGVDRIILVGDARQLPPIGAGRPFVDIIRCVVPEHVETMFPRRGRSYAELTVPRRHQGRGDEGERLDVLLARQFAGGALDPAADEIWPEIAAGTSDRLRVVQWVDAKDLEAKLTQELVSGLSLKGPDDVVGFEVSIGGTVFEKNGRCYFSNKFKDRAGAATKADAWQVLSPVRATMHGVDALNRMLQERFRHVWYQEATKQDFRFRKVPKPLGPQRLIYGDKVINVKNARRYDVYPDPETEAYIANGDLGIIVGQYKTKTLRGLPRKLEVEFVGQLGYKFGFSSREFGDEGPNPLELAYALTVHKTQGSEFGMTFVVVPNPCWLLSREMLYTALTRHQNRIILLHQGPMLDIRRFASEEYSEVAQRMTNLFVDPQPREVIVGAEHRFLENGLIYRTERGELVRSKSELVIADKLFAREVDYKYEQRLLLAGRERFPDFTIHDDARGSTFYWEHLGLLDDPGYAARWERKLADYRASGILPHDEGTGEEGTLIITRDDPGGALDSNLIAELISTVLGR